MARANNFTVAVTGYCLPSFALCALPYEAVFMEVFHDIPSTEFSFTLVTVSQGQVLFSDFHFHVM